MEFWSVSAGNSNLRYSLYGRGVKPEFTVSPEDGVLNMGKAKLGKTTKKQILVSNDGSVFFFFALCSLPLLSSPSL